MPDEKQSHWVLPATPHHTDGITTVYPYRKNDSEADSNTIDDDDTELEVDGYQSFPFLPKTPEIKRRQLGDLFLPLPDERTSLTLSTTMISLVKESNVVNKIASVFPSISGMLSKVQGLQVAFCGSRLMQGLAEEAMATPGLGESSSKRNADSLATIKTTTNSNTIVKSANTKSVLKPICFHRSQQRKQDHLDEKVLPSVLYQRNEKTVLVSRTLNQKDPSKLAGGSNGRGSGNSELLVELAPLRSPGDLLKSQMTKVNKENDFIEDGFENISTSTEMSLLDLDNDNVAVEIVRK